MARPQKSPLELRTRNINIRVTEIEHAMISDKAQKSHKAMSDFARASILNKRVEVQSSNIPDFTTRHELNRIGVNLNQMARVLNAGGNHDGEKLNDLISKLDILFDNWISYESPRSPKRT